MTEAEMKFVRDRFAYWQSRHRRMQQQCPHAKTVKTPFTIEWYVEKTLYKFNCTCEACGKQWVEDQ